MGDVTEAGITEVLMLAETTPRRIAAASIGLDEARLALPPSPGEWSALDILNHLRACEEVWMHSIYAMLAHDSPNLQEIHPRQWIKTANPYTTQSFVVGLQVFTLRRDSALKILSKLPLAAWAREARIDRKTHTVYSHVRRMVLHENGHCGEIEAALK